MADGNRVCRTLCGKFLPSPQALSNRELSETRQVSQKVKLLDALYRFRLKKQLFAFCQQWSLSDAENVLSKRCFFLVLWYTPVWVCALILLAGSSQEIVIAMSRFGETVVLCKMAARPLSIVRLTPLPDMIWLVLLALFLYIYQPLVLWDMRGAFPVTPVYVACLAIIWVFNWLFNPNRRLFGSIVTIGVLMYTLVITVATLYSPYSGIFQNYEFQKWVGHVLLAVIFLTSAKTDRDFAIVLVGLLVVYAMYMAHSYWDFLHGRMEVAMGTERLIGSGGRDPNFFATEAVCLSLLLIPLITLCRKHWHYLFVLGYILLLVRVVVLSGSRTGFVLLLTLTTLATLFSRHRFSLLPVLLIAIPVGWVFMPEQYQDRFRSVVVADINRAGDVSGQGRRGEAYLRTLEMLLDGDFTAFGTGPGTYVLTSASGYASHNLPKQLLTEVGLFGVFAFLFMLTCVAINHFNIWRHYKYLQEKKLGKEGLLCWRVSMAAVFSIPLLLLQGFALHNAFNFPWIWFAAFQALAATFMQERATAAMHESLLPRAPVD